MRAEKPVSAPRRSNAEDAAKVLGSLSHPTRLLLVCLLMHKECNAGELLERLGTTKGNISQHLRILEQQKLIQSRKDGNRVFYSILDKRLGKLLGTLESLYCQQGSLLKRA